MTTTLIALACRVLAGHTNWPSGFPLEERVALVTAASILHLPEVERLEGANHVGDSATDLYRWEMNGAAMALRQMPGYGNPLELNLKWAVLKLQQHEAILNTFPPIASELRP